MQQGFLFGAGFALAVIIVVIALSLMPGVIHWWKARKAAASDSTH